MDDERSLDSLEAFRERQREIMAMEEERTWVHHVADLHRMAKFVEDEIRPLVTLSVGDIDAVGSTRRFAGKILSNRPGDRLEALR